MKTYKTQSVGPIAICAVLGVTSVACDPSVSFGPPLDQGNGLGGQGGDVSSSSSGQAGAGGAGGAASSSSSGQAGAGGAGGGTSSSSSSGQAGAGGAGGGTSSSSSGQAGAGGAGMCLDGQTQSCYTGPIGTENVGACKSGAQTCVGGAWSTCVGEIQPAVEVCDDIDNDCNGQVDEGNPGGGLTCTTGQLGACAAGTTACSGGSVVCNGQNQPTAEVCDNIDNDCDGQVDEGNPGGGATCTTGQPGACSAGTMVCAGGVVVCNATNQPTNEACDNIDNDCDGEVDEGNPGGGVTCISGQPGACSAGTTACTGGALVCNATNQPTAEACDNIDNDCDGQVDEGNPGGGLTCVTGQLGVCNAGTTACTGGAVVCMVTNQPTAEACDNIDNDCDGQVDEGNPGGGLTCATGQLGVCNAGTTACVGGVVACTLPNLPSTEVCDNIDNDCDGQVDEDNSCPPQQIVCGAFVAPPGVGAPGNPGTQAQPVSTIAQAQGIVALSGSDICLCDTPTSGATTYQEDVTMFEGISIYGGYNCADWTRDINTYITEIKGSVSFSGGITSDTVLDGLSVIGKDYTVSMPQPDTSIAISISNSSPRLVNVKASGGLADYSTGLAVRASNGGVAAPAVIGGVYSAQGNGWGSFSAQTGVSLYNAGGTFTNVSIFASGIGENSTGLSCQDCGATITGGSIGGGSSQKYTYGIYVWGNASNLSITNATINGGYANSGVGHAMGVYFANCIGSPILTGVTVGGGSSPGQTTGIVAAGPSCTPAITNSTISAGAGYSGNTGIACYNSSACVVTNSTISADTNNFPNAVTCWGSGCGRFSGNLIKGTNYSVSSSVSIVQIDGSNPTFYDNEFVGPTCSSPSSGMSEVAIVRFLGNSAATFTNNVFRDQPCLRRVEAIRVENASPILRNNTVQFATCAGCGSKYGLFVNGSTSTLEVTNNIFFNAGTDNLASAFAIAENTASSDIPIFANNLLWAPNGGTLYWDEGTSALSLAAINNLPGSAGNISADPLLDATFHLLPASPCRNAGIASGAPNFDFDGDARPQENAYDIGADEYVP